MINKLKSSCGSARGMASQSLTGLSGLDARETLKFVALDADPATKANFACCATDETDTVRVEGLVDRSSAGLSTGDGDTRFAGLGLLVLLGLAPLAQVLDHGRLHCELDPVERKEPNNVPDPDNTDPATRNGTDIGEAPVGVGSNDGGDKLSNAEGTHKGKGRPLKEEESV